MNKDLSIWAVMPDVLGRLRDKHNVLVIAPPGSGKTTQVPQAILDNGISGTGTILVVQPRRIACRAAAQRVAQERTAVLGEEIGYLVRYERKTSVNTKICFVTDGVLLRFFEQDPLLSWVSVVVFDEFHERHVASDLALALTKAAQARRPDLRIMVMSATMDVEPARTYLRADAVESSMVNFPIDIRYVSERPSESDVSEMLAQQIAAVCDESQSGDILAFLPGKSHIREAEKALGRLELKDAIVLPLHSELETKKQDQIFAATRERKIILATNIAETSLTIPGIAIVVDSGFERRMTFDPETGTESLAITPISQASAAQRSGRAGRLGPGLCIRLWPESDHTALEKKTPPEIQRVDLGRVILTLKATGIRDVASFNFLERPQDERLATAEKTLELLGALDDSGYLTQDGRMMLRLPLPPREARMVVEAERAGCLKEVSIIAAFLAGRRVFVQSPNEGRRAIDTHRTFAFDTSSDCFTLVRIFMEAYRHAFTPTWCQKNYLSMDALLEAKRLRWNILRTMFQHRGASGYLRYPHWRHPTVAEYRTLIRRSIAAGLFVDRVAKRIQPGRYQLATGSVANLDQSSVADAEFIVVGNQWTLVDGNGITHFISIATEIERTMLEQLGAKMFRHDVRILGFFPTAHVARVVREERYHHILLSSQEELVDADRACRVEERHKMEAIARGYRQVDVTEQSHGKHIVRWGDQDVQVSATSPGTYWATVTADGTHCRITLHTQIFNIQMGGAAFNKRFAPISNILARIAGRSGK